MDDPSLPSSIEEVELVSLPGTITTLCGHVPADFLQLITALYAPGAGEDVARIQDVLHRLQRSANGWLLAQELLSRPDEKVKFFGVLTVIVKLNTERQDFHVAHLALY